MSPGQTIASYEVLSPWAEADPIPIKGLAPRLDKIDGKKIGLPKNWAPLVKRYKNVVHNYVRY